MPHTGIFHVAGAGEKFFYICCFLTQGSSYISATSYGLMHRLHHARTHKPEDPHSPHNEPNPFLRMRDTEQLYFKIWIGKAPVEEKYRKDLPRRDASDRIAHNWVSRLLWAVAYFVVCFYFAAAGWQWLFLPLTVTMGSLHGVVVNRWAHQSGYGHYRMNNTSGNILPPDLLFAGGAYHNNHHKHPGRPDNAVRWLGCATTYFITKGLNKAG